MKDRSWSSWTSRLITELSYISICLWHPFKCIKWLPIMLPLWIRKSKLGFLQTLYEIYLYRWEKTLIIKYDHRNSRTWLCLVVVFHIRNDIWVVPVGAKANYRPGGTSINVFWGDVHFYGHNSVDSFIFFLYGQYIFF